MPDGHTPMSVYPAVAVDFVCQKVSGSETFTASLVEDGRFIEQKVGHQGSFIGYRIVSSDPRATGAIRLRFRKNGQQYGQEMGDALDATHPISNLQVQGMSVDYFKAGDTLGVDVIASNWGPKADLKITLYLAVEP